MCGTDSCAVLLADITYSGVLVVIKDFKEVAAIIRH